MTEAHPCPVCGRPTTGRARQYLSVCGDCDRSTVCGDGRPVTAVNVSLFGGFRSLHRDDDSVCDQVTQDGRVWVRGVECRMGEARFGGIFVGIATE